MDAALGCSPLLPNWQLLIQWAAALTGFPSGHSDGRPLPALPVLPHWPGRPGPSEALQRLRPTMAVPGRPGRSRRCSAVRCAPQAWSVRANHLGACHRCRGGRLVGAARAANAGRRGPRAGQRCRHRPVRGVADRPHAAGLLRLRLAGLAAVSLGGVLGGHISFRLAGGANHAEPIPHLLRPGWHYLATCDELPDSKSVRKIVGEIPAVAVRTGDQVHVLADRCSHMSGPLSDGQLADGCLTRRRRRASICGLLCLGG